MAKGVTFTKLNGEHCTIGIVTARWNKDITNALRDKCIEALKDSSVKEENIVSIEVPGSFELVQGAKHLLDKCGVDAVVCIGLLVKGETFHFEYISEALTQGIMQLNLYSGKPVIYGVLNCLSEEQAKARIQHAYEWGLSAVEMGLLTK